MSSTPKSPPSTPSRRNMAVEKLSRTRTPLPNGANREKKSNENATAVPENMERADDTIKVPSTSPSLSSDTAMNETESQVSNGHQPNGHAHKGYSSQSSGYHEQPVDGANQFDVSTLPPFDWEDFRRRYRADLKQVDADETSLLDDFDKLAQSFVFWSDTAANRDNLRAAKRLCTREKYVDLAEEALAEKQRRYVQVVGAFKQALEMLRGSGL